MGKPEVIRSGTTSCCRAVVRKRGTDVVGRGSRGVCNITQISRFSDLHERTRARARRLATCGVSLECGASEDHALRRRNSGQVLCA